MRVASGRGNLRRVKHAGLGRILERKIILQFGRNYHVSNPKVIATPLASLKTLANEAYIQSEQRNQFQRYAYDGGYPNKLALDSW
jgi:hypothetical protein